MTEEIILKDEDIISIEKTVYGDSYQAHVLEQYKLCVGSAEKVTDRRKAANGFFLTLNSALMSVGGYVLASSKGASLSLSGSLLSLVGAVLALTWAASIERYRRMNKDNYLVIREIEKYLPLKPYSCARGFSEHPKGKAGCGGNSRIERLVPWLFAAAYLVAAVLLSRS